MREATSGPARARLAEPSGFATTPASRPRSVPSSRLRSDLGLSVVRASAPRHVFVWSSQPSGMGSPLAKSTPQARCRARPRYLCDSLKYQMDDVSPGNARRMGKVVVGQPQVIGPVGVPAYV